MSKLWAALIDRRTSEAVCWPRQHYRALSTQKRGAQFTKAMTKIPFITPANQLLDAVCDLGRHWVLTEIIARSHMSPYYQ
jgi:hypothetical protein